MAVSSEVNAALVGANTVKLPSPLRVVTKSGYLVKAVTRMDKSGVLCANSTIDLSGFGSSASVEQESKSPETTTVKSSRAGNLKSCCLIIGLFVLSRKNGKDLFRV